MANSNKTILVVRSVTTAMKGQKLLEQNGINTVVVRNSAPSSKQGCGYGLQVANSAVPRAQQILASNSIPVSDIQRG